MLVFGMCARVCMCCFVLWSQFRVRWLDLDVFVSVSRFDNVKCPFNIFRLYFADSAFPYIYLLHYITKIQTHGSKDITKTNRGTSSHSFPILQLFASYLCCAYAFAQVYLEFCELATDFSDWLHIHIFVFVVFTILIVQTEYIYVFWFEHLKWS